MAERPTPYSIAVCALIALRSDPSSSLHDIELNSQEDSLSSFLAVFGNAPNADLVPWLKQMRQQVPEVCHLLMDTLTMACESVDSLVDLMESLRVAISEGLVDAVSAHGVFLRQICLGFEELSFESVTLLWQHLKDQLGQLRIENNNYYYKPLNSSWPLSTEQMERMLRQDCLNLEHGTTDDTNHTNISHPNKNHNRSFESVELEIRSILEKDPELPAAYFLRFLNCLKHGERVGALDALHQYFDHAMVQHTSPKDILQFSAILLAVTHSSFGDKGLALMATEEAVRVAQQSKDAACVAFALGWLFENNGHGTAERRELLKRCATRAGQGRLRPLVAGSNLALAKHYLEEDRRTPAAAWNSLFEVNSEPTTDPNLPNVDRPTYMPPLPKEAMESLARQQLVAAGIWDAFGMPALSGLSSIVALNGHNDLSSEDVLTAIQNVSRLALYGTPSNLLSGGKLDLESPSEGHDCVYAKAISTLMQLRQHFSPSNSNFDDSFLHNTALLLHEWAVNRGDLDDAKALEIVLDSYLHPGLANFDQLRVDIGMQKCLLLCREQNWEKARELGSCMLEICQVKMLKSHRARLLIQLAILQLESNPKEFISAVPPLLEALSLCESCEMHGLHAAALSVLSKVFLRLLNPKRSLSLLRATIPTLQTREHVWFQADAFLTEAKCHLQLANTSKASMSKKRFQAAITGLGKSQELFVRCQDFLRLREVLYLQARVFSLLGKVNEREAVSKRFTDICEYLRSRSCAKTSCASSILDALVDPSKLNRLVERAM